MRLGGFPEPFFGGSERAWRRWQSERLERVVRDDLRDLERVRDLSLIELLIDALPARIGAPLSIICCAKLLFPDRAPGFDSPMMSMR